MIMSGSSDFMASGFLYFLCIDDVIADHFISFSTKFPILLQVN